MFPFIKNLIENLIKTTSPLIAFAARVIQKHFNNKKYEENKYDMLHDLYYYYKMSTC